MIDERRDDRMGITRKREVEEARLFHELNDMIAYHMKEMQQCLMTAGKIFNQYDREISGQKQGREVVESTILKECVGCQEKKRCKFTVEDKDWLGQVMEKRGGLSLSDFRHCHSCKKEQDFVEEANRIYERELFLRSMEQGIVQMRKTIGEQYIEAGKMLGGFASGQFEMSKENGKLKQKIKKEFAQKNLAVKEIYLYENEEKGKQIYLFVKKKIGREITARQAAALLSKIVQKKMQPLLGQKKIIGNRYEMIGFSLAAKFHVLGGVISKAYQNGDKNGDCFSMGNIGERRFVSVISDGMGTGMEANNESRRMVDTLEELLEAGISENRAILLLQSLFAFLPEKEQYATLDYFQMDLFAGIGTFLKMGACPCFLKRKGHAEVLKMESFPVGYEKKEKLPFYRKKLESEDLILQVSDGVLDSMKGNGEEMICRFMEEIKAIRPQAFAEELMHKIERTEGYREKDDMTVIALGIWDKY